jgi:adenosylmethionine-8-amino-7-oxononanoate aminotransferase
MPGMNGKYLIEYLFGLVHIILIMQWIPLIKNIQSAGKSVVIDLQKDELDSFIGEVKKEGIFLCIESSSTDEQKEILKRVEKGKLIFM